MGIAPSKDNEELVDTLVKAGHIQSTHIELAFRLVDRGRYVPEKYLKEIYGDQPFKVPESDAASWTPGFLHISAPCMYACVLEKLDIRKGHAFLNVGSGSGWLNTACGFLVGEKGVNHGVEIHSNLVEYAENLMNTSTIQSGAVAGYEWCKPKFMHSNGLTLKNADDFEGYDRIYCGASIRDPNTVFRLMRLLKVGGRMVAPYHSVLFSFYRVSQSTIRTENITTCQFADLLLPESGTPLSVLFPCQRPTPLKIICRYHIRKELRRKTDCSHDFVVTLKLAREEKEQQIWSSDDFQHTAFGPPENSAANFQAANPRLVPNSFLTATELSGRPFSTFFRPGIHPENSEVPGTEDYLIPVENEEQKSIYIEYPLNMGEPEEDEAENANDIDFHGHQLDDETFLDNILGFAARHIGVAGRTIASEEELQEREAEEEARRVVQFSRVTHGRVTIEPPVDASLNLMDGRTRRFRFVQDGTQNNIYGVLDPNYRSFDHAGNGTQAQPRSSRRNYDEANASTDTDDLSERSSSPKRARWENKADDGGESLEPFADEGPEEKPTKSTTNERRNERRSERISERRGERRSERISERISERRSERIRERISERRVERRSERRNERDRFCDCTTIRAADEREMSRMLNTIESAEEKREILLKGMRPRFYRVPENLLNAYGTRFHQLLRTLPIPKHLKNFVRLQK
ncbi:unnamed protein product [Auanema sp. JU1783]|nr:unnamed protein product [Auanema sp. JU1783]